MSDGFLQLTNVSKRFRRGVAHDSLGELVASTLRRAVGGKRRARAVDDFFAVDALTFEANPGEAVGLIGPNGAGKSTALKLIARILRPDRGSVNIRGRLTALIEISAGFHGDLTGRENIYMNGAILGMRTAEIDRKLDAIVAFSGVEAFIDTPVKRYSAGMQARLGFSVAAHVDPEVLLVDEVLAVGDVMFRQRCIQRMQEMVAGGVVLLFVTHNLEQMQSFCSRALVMNHGRSVFDGPPSQAVAHYLDAVQANGPRKTEPTSSATEQIVDLHVRSGDGDTLTVARADHPLTLDVLFQTSQPFPRLAVEIDVRRDLGDCLANFSSIRDEKTYAVPRGRSTIRLALPSLPLGGGAYLLKAMLRDAASGRVVANSGFRFHLFIEDGGRPTGALCLPHTWSNGVSENEPLARPHPGRTEATQEAVTT